MENCVRTTSYIEILINKGKIREKIKINKYFGASKSLFKDMFRPYGALLLFLILFSFIFFPVSFYL